MATQYDRGYSDFRGVDFTSDPSEVSDHRFADALNVWRDYRSQNGAAIETFPGYRRLACLPERNGGTNGIYELPGEDTLFLIFHLGQKLYYVKSSNIDQEGLGKEISLPSYFSLPNAHMCGKLFHNRLLLLGGGAFVSISIDEGGVPVLDLPPALVSNAPEEDLIKFYEKRSAYIPTTYLNGKAYEQKNMLSRWFKERWTEINVDENAANPSTGVVHGGRSFLLTLHERAIGYLDTVALNLSPLYINGEGCEFVTNGAGTITGFKWEAPDKCAKIDAEFIIKDDVITQIFFKVGDGYFNKDEIVVEACLLADASYTLPEYISFSDACPEYTAKEAVCDCTVMEVYDGRVFFTGNPRLPNTTFYCGRNAETGFADPTYVGYLNYFNDGLGRAVNRGLLSIGGYLCIFKEQAGNAVSVYYRLGADTEDDLLPRIYIQTEGPLGISCYGECCNFADDAVFISERGLDALGKLATNTERSVMHRSTNVDKRLLREELSKAKLVEWEGYLVLLCPSGNAYLADSRAVYESRGSFEYEWFFLSALGEQKGDKAYRYAAELPHKYAMLGETRSELTVDIGGKAYPVRIKGVDEAICKGVHIYSNCTLTWDAGKLAGATVSLEGDVAYLLFSYEGERWPMVQLSDGKYREGKFYPATAIASIDSRLYFGTINGSLYVVNTDKRGEDGLIPRAWYTFDGIAITSGVMTKMDDCGSPHLAKRTVPRTCVIDMKSMPGSSFSCLVRTDVKDWSDISSASASQLDFGDLSFDALAFVAMDNAKFALKDRTRRYSQKQYQIFSNKYQRPFGLCKLFYSYEVTGRLRLR